MGTIFENAATVPVNTLRNYTKNPRRGDVDLIAESLRVTGQYKPILVNRGTMTGRLNEVLTGNHTLMAAKALGWLEVAAVFVDVGEEVARRIVLADNRTSDVGGYDESLLLELLQSADSLEGTGYDGDDLLQLMGNTYEEPVYEADPDETPDVPDEPRAKLGEVWILGEHRVICGDATDPDVLRKLMAGDEASMVWTDPPYGVDYVGKTKQALTIQNDGKAGLAALLRDSFGALLSVVRPGAPFYCAHADTERVTFQLALEHAGFSVRQNLIWAKSTMVMGRSDYHYKHEPILYGFAPGGEGRLGRGGPNWHGDNAQTTVFNVDKPAASREHPTQKPVDLVKAMLRNSAHQGDLVIDPFGGSGSTLVAADSLGMRARLVELDPRYVDVICLRYQRLTGVAAILEGEEA